MDAALAPDYTFGSDPWEGASAPKGAKGASAPEHPWASPSGDPLSASVGAGGAPAGVAVPAPVDQGASAPGADYGGGVPAGDEIVELLRQIVCTYHAAIGQRTLNRKL